MVMYDINELEENVSKYIDIFYFSSFLVLSNIFLVIDHELMRTSDTCSNAYCFRSVIHSILPVGTLSTVQQIFQWIFWVVVIDISKYQSHLEIEVF